MTVTELKVWFMTQCTFNNQYLSLAHDLEAVAENFLFLCRVLSQFPAVNHEVKSLPKSE